MSINKKNITLGVIVLMSLKGTATLTAAMLLPTWRSRFIALGVLALIILLAIVRHRRKKKYADRASSTE